MNIKVKGTNGTIIADDEKVSISRKGFIGFVTQGIKGDRIIYYKDMKSIEYKKPTMWANGYIQFITNAELSTRSKVNLIGGTSKAAQQDPNLVILRAFKKQMIIEGQKLYDFVLEKLEEYKKYDSPTSVTNMSTADEIAKFKKLLDDNVITQEEFDKKKIELLNLWKIISCPNTDDFKSWTCVYRGKLWTNIQRYY